MSVNKLVVRGSENTGVSCVILCFSFLFIYKSLEKVILREDYCLSGFLCEEKEEEKEEEEEEEKKR